MLQAYCSTSYTNFKRKMVGKSKSEIVFENVNTDIPKKIPENSTCTILFKINY